MHMQRLAGFSTGRAAPAFIHPCRRSCHLPAARRSTSTWRMARRAPTCPALAQATPSAPPACSTTCASPRWGGGWAEWSCSASVPRCDRWLGVLPASHSVLPPPARSAAHLPACLPGLPARLPLQIFGALTKSANTDIHEVIGEDATTNNMHHNAEQFDRKTEMSFKYLQVGAAVPVCGAGAVVWSNLMCVHLAAPTPHPTRTAGLHRLLQLLCPRLQRCGECYGPRFGHLHRLALHLRCLQGRCTHLDPGHWRPRHRAG